MLNHAACPCLSRLSVNGHFSYAFANIRHVREWRQVGRRTRVQVPVSAVRQSSKIETPKELLITPWTGSPPQLEALSDLNNRLSDAPHSLDQDTVRWFLRDREFDPVEAEEKIVKTAQWRKKIGYDTLSPEEFALEQTRGKVRLYEHRDILERPVIILDASKHRIGEFPVDSTQKLCAYAVKEAMDQLTPDAGTFITIFDLRNFGTSNADLQFVRYMIDLFFVYHPKRLGQSLLVEAPWVFQPVWQFVKPLLRKYAALVRFVDASQVRQEYFTEQTVPKEFKEQK